MPHDIGAPVSPTLPKRSPLHTVYLNIIHLSGGQKRLTDAGRTFRIQAIHHSTDQLELVLQAEVDEVCIYEHTVRWNKGIVVLQEKCRRNLRSDGWNMRTSVSLNRERYPYKRRTAFSFSASSFCFCLSWFSFLQIRMSASLTEEIYKHTILCLLDSADA